MLLSSHPFFLPLRYIIIGIKKKPKIQPNRTNKRLIIIYLYFYNQWDF